MVLSNFVTMQRIRETVGQPLSRALLLEIHSLVTDGTLDEPDGAGRFRRPTERRHVADLEGNVFHEPPPAEELDQRFESMAAFANDAEGPFIHPVLRAIVLHFWLAYDHPFVDGNGRTARALFYWSMLSHGYWLFEFLSISAVILRAPIQYYRAFVLTETDDNDLTYFLLHQLDVIGKAVDSLHAYIERRSAELHETELLLRSDLVLNHRQKDLVRHALRHPHAVYTIEGHAQSHSVAYGTARSDLLGMAEQGLLIKNRQGKRYTFAAAPELRDRLSRQP
jgi:Fic family protein